jgi:hypothetical protein
MRSMLIGTRKVRSAGRASGSIEITLPPELAALEGVDCRIVLRDGARPEIVLEPNLAPAIMVFTRVWARLRALTSLAGDIGDFPVQECEIVLFPGPQRGPGRPFANGRPTLAYSQALQVSRVTVFDQKGDNGRSEEALAGVIAPLAAVAGQRLGLTGVVAAAFGVVLARLAAPTWTSHEADPEGAEFGAARRTWLEICGPSAPPLSVLAPDGDDARAQQALQRIVSQFRRWQERPDQHELTRVHLAGGVTVSTLESFIEQARQKT